MHGRWRDSEQEAVEDAIRVGQATKTGESPESWRWLVLGSIESAELDGTADAGA